MTSWATNPLIISLYFGGLELSEKTLTIPVVLP